MADRFSQTVLTFLRRAGWQEGRKVSQFLISIPGLSLFAKAQEVLTEFGGLHIGEYGPGLECAASDVNLDPHLAIHLGPELRNHESSNGLRLFPLGEVHRGHGYLIIDENDHLYLLSDELTPYSNSFVDGLEALLLGKRAPLKDKASKCEK